MEDVVQLTVYQNSPHIWSGGLEGKGLALWLLGKANAILALEFHREHLDEARESFIELQASEHLLNDYASLGLSQKMTDSIHPLSMEVVQFDRDIGGEFQRLSHLSPNQVKPIPPLGYSELSVLGEAREEFLRKKVQLSELVTNRYEQKLGD
nr:hypothetical protein [Serratia sp. P2ACOL2]